MTNNPTIDGVSRDAFKWAIQQLEEDGHKGCGYFDSLRAILDTPAVERQEPVAEVVATGGPHDKEDRVLVELQAELPAIGTKIYAAPPEVAALQSTIAQLQARIVELESGRGEMVEAMLLSDCEEFQHEIYGAGYFGTDVIELFTAPPAPVAVVLPERIAFTSQGTFDQGWNACLAATAALNGPVK